VKPLAFAAALAAAICFCLPLAGSASGNVDRLQEQSSAASGRIDELSARLNEDRAGFDQARQRADAAAAQESDLTGRIETGEARVLELRSQLETETDNLERTRQRLRRAERLLAGRLTAIYVAGPVETIDAVLGSEDFAQLSSRTEYLLSIREADQRLAGRVRSVRDSLKSSVARLEKLDQEARAQVAALDAARDEISLVRSEAEANAAELASISSSREQEIDALRADIDQWEERIQEEQAKSAAEAETEVAAELGGPYSIPTYIVMCESGGDYGALNASSGAGGAYQIMPETWAAYGGTGLPHEASKAEQDRIAALIYADSGTAPWVCG
jgi:peptidoglycan hydrolase CwlO-like protein